MQGVALSLTECPGVSTQPFSSFSAVNGESLTVRIMKKAYLDEDEWIQTRLDQLNLSDEKRLAAVCHGQMYQKLMTEAFNKKIKHQVYHPGDLVINNIILPQGDPQGKWTPTYEGPFVIRKYSLAVL